MSARAPVGFVYVNGHVVPAAGARVSVFDRGFLYGDGLFETMRSYRGALFGLSEHLARLRASARWLRIPVPSIDWSRAIERLLRRNDWLVGDAAVRITLTRGPGRPGLLPPAAVTPTVLIVATMIGLEVARAQRRGARVTLLPFARAGATAGHKTLDYVPAILGRMQAQRVNAFEALYVTPRGHVTEGTTSNLFVVRRGALLTPPLDSTAGVLPGVTRRLVMDLARTLTLRVRECRVPVRELLAAEEAFCTSSVVEIVPIVRVDNRPIADGRCGALTRQLQLGYRARVGRAS
ncbi:MAG: aminotransferase class IV [Deltaproteobacteria bacterium]|nr:aminotransferase class IV [Deltaproteobacteria bacterium]